MTFWSRFSLSQTRKEPAQATLGEVQPRESYWVRLKKFFARIVTFFRFSFVRISMFILLILMYVIAKITFHIWYWRILWKERHSQAVNGVTAGTPSEILFSRYAERLFRLFHTANGESIDKVSLIEIAIRNMKGKKTRTAVTIGGMAIGIGSIVFLVSIGYGLQRLVISQVAELEEMQQADVSLQPGGKIKMNDETLNTLSQIPNIVSVDPLISVVGKVNYQNSVSDMAVYGVTTHYLEQSALRPVRGSFYNSLDVVLPDNDHPNGSSAENTPKERGGVVEETVFSTSGLHWVRARAEAVVEAETVGFIRVDTTEQIGQIVWGDTYTTSDTYGKAGLDSQGQPLGKWMKTTTSLFREESCVETEADCVGGEYVLERDADGYPVERIVYFALTDDWLVFHTLSQEEKQKLAQDAAAPILNIVQSGDGWVEIEGEGTNTPEENIERVALAGSAKREAVVSRAMLRILGLNEDESIGKTFNTSFVVTGSLLEDSQKKLESIPADYTIVGIIPEDKSPIFYVPFIDLRGLGIRYYSQSKVTAANQDILSDVRKQIEGLGYVTTSVADTVSQINTFFSSARIILGLLGMVALGVAALGMFNTLTVSLLERTREVGLMKAIGMKSVEVQELFLTESMVMAFFGGILGLLFGFLAGKALGAGLSLLAIFRGVGAIDVSYIPAPFVIAIVIFTLIVGIITGIYPARRATNISALNALRYE
ncbi:MAG: ABC transporter permease [Candidatus Moraniibacteriota bacterium]|nr:MAG: ABC transporter permease [Candidatus Moranbacteria bacterium]